MSGKLGQMVATGIERRFARICALCLCSFATNLVSAVSSANQNATQVAPSTQRVRLQLRGSLSAQRVRELSVLLKTELERSGLALSVNESSMPARSWLEQATSDERVLLLASLDTSGADEWLLYIVDPRRKKAILRRLPSGAQEDAAALEAIASIVVSAANALQDGLEVASRGIGEVVSPTSEATGQTESSDADSTTAPEQLDRKAQTKERAPAPERRRESSRWGGASRSSRASRPLVVRGYLGPSLSTFDSEALLTFGPLASLGLTIDDRFSVGLSFAQHLARTIETEFGAFDVSRSQFWGQVGPHFSLQHWQFEPGVNIGLERLSRKDAVAADGIEATDDRASVRWAIGLGAKLRLVLSSAVSLEGLLAINYYIQRLNFTATVDEKTILTPFRPSATSSLGLEVRSP